MLCDGADAETCPVSIVWLARGLETPFPTDAIVYDSTYVNDWTAHVAFDRTQSHMFLSANSGGRLNAAVRVVETYDLTGVPAGTPVNATLEFAADGWSLNVCGGAGCGVECVARVVTGADSVAADANQMGPGNGYRYLSTTLSLPVTMIAGTPFRAEFYFAYGTGPGGSASAEVSGGYRVTGLPPGVTAIPCAGAVTSLRHATWGSVKSIYR